MKLLNKIFKSSAVLLFLVSFHVSAEEFIIHSTCNYGREVDLAMGEAHLNDLELYNKITGDFDDIVCSEALQMEEELLSKKGYECSLSLNFEMREPAIWRCKK
ncbi:MAG: hypothetical protein GDA46_07455 [Bdellovibrionales bacterium]|nr:hypothetical protein [Bdellovibrionales bacterium]